MHEHSYHAQILLEFAESRCHIIGRDEIAVKTWCRICGLPVLLEVLTDYDEAVRYFCGLDDHPMVHKSLHAEAGGWGTHWRLDEVLEKVFPLVHTDHIWPIMPWWMDIMWW